MQMSLNRRSGSASVIPSAGDVMPPASRRSFRSVGDELVYCCAKANHFLLLVERRRSAGRYVERLRVLLRRVPNRQSIAFATAKALVSEYDRDLAVGGVWRRREAQRIAELYRKLGRRSRVEAVAASWPWPNVGVRAVENQCRRVWRLYSTKASPRDSGLVLEAMRSIKWLRL
jgi:hypothetical protein